MTRLELLLEKLLDGELGDEEAREFTAVLRSDRIARDLYRRHVTQHALLRWDRCEARQITAPVVGKSRRFTRNAIRYAAAAAVVLSFAAVMSVLVSLDGARRPASAGAPVATLIDADHAVWESSGSGVATPTPGSPVAAGFVRLKSGVATLEFHSGAQVTLTGPAEFGLNSPRHGFLRRGRLTAYVPPPAHGFTIAAPGCAVLDLGTAFGLRVDSHGVSEVYVTRGRVRVTNADGARELPAGEAARVTADRLQMVNPAALAWAGPVARRLVDDAAGPTEGFSERWSAVAWSNIARPQLHHGPGHVMAAEFQPWGVVRRLFPRTVVNIGDRVTVTMKLKAATGAVPAMAPAELRIGLAKGPTGGGPWTGSSYAAQWGLSGRALLFTRRHAGVTPLGGDGITMLTTRVLPGLVPLGDGRWHKVEVTFNRSPLGMEISASCDGQPAGGAMDTDLPHCLGVLNQLCVGAAGRDLKLEMDHVSVTYTPSGAVAQPPAGEP